MSATIVITYVSKYIYYICQQIYVLHMSATILITHVSNCSYYICIDVYVCLYTNLEHVSGHTAFLKHHTVKFSGDLRVYRPWEWDVSHMWTRHVTHMQVARHTSRWIMSHVWTSHVPPTWMGHVTRVNESCGTDMGWLRLVGSFQL